MHIAFTASVVDLQGPLTAPGTEEEGVWQLPFFDWRKGVGKLLYKFLFIYAHIFDFYTLSFVLVPCSSYLIRAILLRCKATRLDCPCTTQQHFILSQRTFDCSVANGPSYQKWLDRPWVLAGWTRYFQKQSWVARWFDQSKPTTKGTVNHFPIPCSVIFLQYKHKCGAYCVIICVKYMTVRFNVSCWKKALEMGVPGMRDGSTWNEMVPHMLHSMVFLVESTEVLVV